MIGVNCPLRVAGQLALLAGIITFDTIAKLIAYEGRSEILLKWPNDILLAGEKVAGMLLEDLLVIDAPTVWVDRSDPDNTNFKIIDGATMKIVIGLRAMSAMAARRPPARRISRPRASPLSSTTGSGSATASPP